MELAFTDYQRRVARAPKNLPSVRHLRPGLYSRSCRLENRSSSARSRRVDSLAIDCLLYSLRFSAFEYHVAIPSFGIDRTPRAKVEHRDVPVDVKRQQRFSEQIGNDVIPSEAPHGSGVLAGHDRWMAAIDQHARGIPGGELGSQSLHLQTFINRESTEAVM